MREEQHKSVILVVDDDTTILSLLQNFLYGEGYEPITASNGVEALQLLEQLEPDLILLDIKMPKLGGLETCARIRASQSLSDVPIIIISAIGEIDDKAKAFRLGANDYVTKPFNTTELLLRIRSLLRSRQMEQEIIRKNFELSALSAISKDLITAINQRDLFKLAARSICERLGYDLCAVLLQDTSFEAEIEESTSWPVVKAVHWQGDSAETNNCRNRPEAAKTDFEKYVNEYIQNSAQPKLEIRCDASNAKFASDEIKIQAIIPLCFKDEILGALVIGSRAQSKLSCGDLPLLSAIGSNLSLAIKNSELYEATRFYLEDVAERVAVRADELEQQKAFTEKIVDSLPVGLSVIDQDYRIAAWNKNREGAYGITREKAIGRSIFEVFRKQPREKLQAEFERVFQTGQIERVETETVIDDETRYFIISKIPMSLAEGKITHVITISEDVTERKRIIEQASKAEKLAAIGQLAAGVVHEINNPLASIAACAEGLLTKLATERRLSATTRSSFEEYLKIIETEAYRCKRITNSLLDFSRAQHSAKENLDINLALEQTLFLLKHHARFKVMNLVKELDYSLSPVCVNEGQIKQALMAIIINAVDAMPDGGTVTVRTSWSDSRRNQICIEIADTGCGIPPQYLSKIFDPFFTLKPRGIGTGLGLSICYGIITEHGGTILVDSVENQGSSFRILLPAVKAVAQEVVA